MPIVYRSGLNESEIGRIEVEINRVLDAEYRKFLCAMNGFYFTAPDYVQIPLSAVDEAAISFDRFFGLLPQEECNDIISFNKEFIEELDFLEEAVAIGEDGGGNPYVLLGKQGKRGVYYWDRTHLHESDLTNNFDIPEQNGCGNLFFVSGSFAEFYELVFKCVGRAPVYIEEV